jgi:5-formyltetrahydrofolate cyclo-ligase
MSVTQEKARLRSLMRTARHEFVQGHPAELAERITGALSNKLVEWGVSAGARVAGYWPIGDEADVRPILHRLHEIGAECALPVVTGSGRPLLFRAWRPGDDLMEGPLATRQPLDDKSEIVPNILLVPGLAFDRNGWRLGQGGGFYDRTIEGLANRAPIFTVGVCFSCQVIEAVPYGPGDVPMDALATEEAAETIERQ